MSLLTISFKVHDSYCYQEWGILNPSISLLELSWVIFHLKPSIGNVAICGAYQWSKLSPYPSRWKRFFISSLISRKQLFFISGRIVTSSFWDVCHKLTTYLLFSLLVFQQLRSTLLLKMLFKLIGGWRCCFLLRSFVPSIQLIFFHSGGIVLLFSSTHLFVLSGSCSFCPYPFNPSAAWNRSYPLCHSFNSSGGSVLLISPSIFLSYQVLIQFLFFSIGVLSTLFFLVPLF